MRKTILSVLFMVALAAAAQVERPKLIVGLVVDQMRWDYLYRFQDEYGEGGLKRLLREGHSFENTMINYVPTVTAIGHASIYTGSTPALHGICGNNFFIDGKEVYCCGDSTVRGVGSDSKKSQMSPHNLLASTIGDELKLATDFRSRVFGVAIKDRAAILPAGHSADAAYWWDTTVGHFISSSYYMDRLPEWVERFNKQNNTKPRFEIVNDNLGVTMTFRMAEALLENEQLGQRGQTDMLAVSISSTDAVGHQVGIDGPEIHSVYKQLDKDLAHFLDELDRVIGRGQYLLFLSADHGGAHNYNYLQNHRIPAAGMESWSMLKPLNNHLKTVFSIDKDLFYGENMARFYLNHELTAALGLDEERVKGEAAKWLKRDKRVLEVVDFDKAATAALPKIICERIANGRNVDRAGDIICILKPQVVITTDNPEFRGTSHGAWNPYDAHIPFVLMGWNVAHGQSSEQVNITDIAPTICSMLHIEMPNAAIGRPVYSLPCSPR